MTTDLATPLAGRVSDRALVASPAMREALLIAFLDRLQRPVRGTAEEPA